MVSITWLHLTDFHQGMSDQDWLWPNVRDDFFKDLRVMQKRNGPWDLVLFTGDLTQRGSEKEFERFQKTWDEINTTLFSLNSHPALLVVPGNHDLVRPKATDPVVKAFAQWDTDEDLAQELFKNSKGQYRKVVTRAFAPFSAWSDSLERPAALNGKINKGILPGDFSATFDKSGLKLGIVGLNSAFLHLTAGNLQGRLALDPRQLHHACAGNAPDWLARHHANILMTHHPADWFGKQSLDQFRAEIDKPGRFVGHFCGHMHTPQTTFSSEGGAQIRRRFQASSLFGLEKWIDGSGAQQNRRHGYSIVRLTIDDEKGELRIWPRVLEKQQQSGHWRMVADTNFFELEEDGSHSTPFTPTQPLNPPPRGGSGQSGPSGTGDLLSASSTKGAPDLLSGRKIAPDTVTETLLSNMLHAKEYPETVWGVPTKLHSRKEFGERVPPCLLREGFLYSFFDPTKTTFPFTKQRTSGNTKRTYFSEWLNNASRQHWALELLHKSLREYLWHRGVAFDSEHHRFYFRPRDGGKSVVVRWLGKTKRTVVKVPDANQGGSWVHQAAYLHFEYISGRLYLSIEPSWAFTTNGRTAVSGVKAGPLSAMWNGPERNGSVLRHVLMWSNLLTATRDGTITCGDQRLAFAPLLATAQTQRGLENDRIAVRALLELTRIEHNLAVPSESFMYIDSNSDRGEDGDEI